MLKEIAGVPAEGLKKVDESLEVVEALRASGKPAVDEIQEAANLIESTGAKEDAWYAFAPGWLKTAAGSLAEIRVLSGGLTALGVAADVGTVISPQDTACWEGLTARRRR